MRDTCSTVPTDPPSAVHPTDIWRAVQIVQLLIMQSSPAFYYFLPLRSKYFAQHSHSVVFPYYDRPVYTNTKQLVTFLE